MMTMDQSHRVGLRLDPLDVLFFRDGRPFDAAARLKGGLPNPQTLAGALRTALLSRRAFNFAKFQRLRAKNVDLREALTESLASEADHWIVNAQFRGPWLALRHGNVIEPLLAQPETLVPVKEAIPKLSRWIRREPLAENTLPNWKDSDLPLQIWTKGNPDEKADPCLFTLKALREYLKGETTFERAELFEVRELYEFDNRTGIGIDMHTLTSGDGNIYGVRLLSLKKRVRVPDRDTPPKKRQRLLDDPYHNWELCLYAEVLPGADAPKAQSWFTENDSIPFGGEGRYVRVDVCDEGALPEWPTPDPTKKDALFYLASPAFFEPASRPLPRVAPGKLMAAASGVGLPVSGWDVARNGPRPTRFAVPAGAVYFVEGACLSEHQSLCTNQDHIDEGWGFALQGEWKRGERS